MNESPASESLLALYEASRSELPGAGAPWLTRLRGDGIAAFQELGLPHKRQEAWRFTDLAALSRLEFGPVSGEGRGQAQGAAESALGAFGKSHALVFIDGSFAPELSSAGDLQIGPLSEWLEHEPRRLEGLLAGIVDLKQRPFTALNTALFEDGLFLEIPRGQQVDRRIHAVFVQSAGQTPSASHPRNLVVARAGSRATVVEHYVGCVGARGLVNPVTEIALEPDARVDHVVLQEQPEESFFTGAVTARQEAGSHFASHSVALGGRLARLDLRATLAGESAHADLFGLYLGSGRQLQDHYTVIDHAVPHTTSNERYKGVLGGRARGVFHGLIQVRPDAQRIHAMQSHRNLLLTDAARVNAKPQLEIYADDVRCSHGATVGRLDEEQLFYLRSRGIDESEARLMLTLGFANEVSCELPLEELRRYLAGRIRAWLPEALGERRA
jgi:Fe-S cluster assembly protein SufD